MPQMAPMLWTLLMLLFIMVLFLFMTKLYFYPLSQPKYSTGTSPVIFKSYWMW